MWSSTPQNILIDKSMENANIYNLLPNAPFSSDGFIKLNKLTN